MFDRKRDRITQCAAISRPQPFGGNFPLDPEKRESFSPPITAFVKSKRSCSVSIRAEKHEVVVPVGWAAVPAELYVVMMTLLAGLAVSGEGCSWTGEIACCALSIPQQRSMVIEPASPGPRNRRVRRIAHITCAT